MRPSYWDFLNSFAIRARAGLYGSYDNMFYVIFIKGKMMIVPTEGNNRVLEQGCSKNYHAGSDVLSDKIDFHDNSKHFIYATPACQFGSKLLHYQINVLSLCQV